MLDRVEHLMRDVEKWSLELQRKNAEAMGIFVGAWGQAFAGHGWVILEFLDV